MKNANTCAGCSHGVPNPQDVQTVLCRRYPPTALLMPTQKGPLLVTQYPAPHAKSTCGEFRMRILIDGDIENTVEIASKP